MRVIFLQKPGNCWWNKLTSELCRNPVYLIETVLLWLLLWGLPPGIEGTRRTKNYYYYYYYYRYYSYFYFYSPSLHFKRFYYWKKKQKTWKLLPLWSLTWHFRALNDNYKKTPCLIIPQSRKWKKGLGLEEFSKQTTKKIKEELRWERKRTQKCHVSRRDMYKSKTVKSEGRRLSTPKKTCCIGAMWFSCACELFKNVKNRHYFDFVILKSGCVFLFVFTILWNYGNQGRNHGEWCRSGENCGCFALKPFRFKEKLCRFWRQLSWKCVSVCVCVQPKQ